MRLFFLMNGFPDEFAFPLCHSTKVNSDDYVDKKLMSTASFEASKLRIPYSETIRGIT
ncbi:hypothetical protein ALC53_07092 [Atta colombica]|uniref:Uncharacterized protein n=1 Tax=Atta colombica TaxID=520822 RepID=A0A195BDF5_9HYME|nr:hypothetical protein ALC53_07092 [Atta colombica]